MTPTRKIAIGAFALGALVAGGVSAATLGSASAADDGTGSSTTVSGSDSNTGTDDGGDGQSGPHSANGVTEEALTGETASSVEAAVLAANPGATIERMETDAEGAAYEAHVTLADGSEATVKVDAAFTVTATETGREGHGGSGRGGPHSANGVTETELSGDQASSVEAAVVAAYPDATVERIETDSEGAAFEAHITQADGTRTTVELDASFAITGTSEDG